MRLETGLKAVTGTFAAMVLLLSLRLSPYAAEDPYILLLPTSSEITYDLDSDHISEEYSADKYTILLYEAGETVEFRVITDYVYSIEDVSDGLDFEDYSVMDGLVSFDMPQKDLCFVLGDELREDAEDSIKEELASESTERLQEYDSGIEIILDGYPSAEVSMVNGSEESVSDRESFHTEESVDLFKVYSSNGFSVSPKISVWKNGLREKDVSGIIIDKGASENYYTIDLSNGLDLSNSYTIEVINPEGQEKLIPKSAYKAEDSEENSISLALIGDMSAKVLMVDGSTVSLEQDEDFKTEDKLDLVDVSFDSGSYEESPDVYIYRNGELLEDVSDIVMSRGDYQGCYRVDLVNSMSLDAFYEIFIVDADASYEELVTDELAEAEEAAEAEEIARAGEAIEEEEAAEGEIAEAEEREAEEVAEEEAIEAEEAVGEEAREEQEAAVETLEEEEAAEEEIIEEEEVAEEEAEAAEAEIAEAAGTTVVPADSGNIVERGGDFSFRIQIDEGYTRTDDFAVKANGVELDENEDGSFTIHDVTDDQTITVEGVKDVTAPEVEIFIDDESLPEEEESYIFSDPVSARIEASDEGSGLKSLEYVLSSESFTETEEIGEWLEYTEEITVEGSEDQFLYIRAVDRDGNETELTTAFSYGIVRPAPAVFGVSESIAGKADGKISGLDSTMEYSTDGSDYSAVTDPDMEFAAGTYYLRYAADENDPASEASEISISEGRKLLAVFIADSAIVDVIEVDYGGSIPENKLPKIPEKEGYETSDADWDAESFDDIKEDMIVRAVYQKNEFTVSFSNALAGFGYSVDHDSKEEASEETERTEADTESAVSGGDEEDFEFSLILFGELLADVEKSDGSMESAEPDSTLILNDSIEKIVVYANTAKKPEILLSKDGAEISEEEEVFELTEEADNSYLIEFKEGAVTDGSWVLIISE